VRKRIVIGLLIVAAIGTALFFASQPNEGTVEWHKREFERHRMQYMEARDQNTWSDRLKRKYYKVTGRILPPRTTAEFHEGLKGMQKNLENMRRHQESLGQLGYVIEVRDAQIAVMLGGREPKWEKVAEVRQADVP